MNYPGVEAACSLCTRRLAATGALLVIWGVAAAVPLLARSSASSWYISWCRQAYALAGPAGQTLAWLSLTLLATGTALAGWALLRGVVASHRLKRHFRFLAAPAPPHVSASAQAAGVAGRLLFIAHPQPVALTIGLIRPLVVVSSSVADGLAGAELTAVLLHEAAHCHNRDPLRRLFWAALANGFSLLPGVTATVGAARSCAELRADAFAARHPGSAGALGQALLKTARLMATTAAPVAPVSAGFHDELVLRARHLVGQDVSEAIFQAAPGRQAPWFMWLTSLLAVWALLVPACVPR